jgi:hypothetical protein
VKKDAAGGVDLGDVKVDTPKAPASDKKADKPASDTKADKPKSNGSKDKPNTGGSGNTPAATGGGSNNTPASSGGNSGGGKPSNRIVEVWIEPTYKTIHHEAEIEYIYHDDVYEEIPYVLFHDGNKVYGWSSDAVWRYCEEHSTGYRTGTDYRHISDAWLETKIIRPERDETVPDAPGRWERVPFSSVNGRQYREIS